MPEKILTLPIGLDGKMRGYHLFQLAKFMNWKGALAKQGMHMASQLAKAFVETDASLLEINPLVETEEGELLALDAKLSVDDNALFPLTILTPPALPLPPAWTCTFKTASSIPSLIRASDTSTWLLTISKSGIAILYSLKISLAWYS